MTAERVTSVDAVNDLLRHAAESGPLAGVLRYNDAPLVASDFNHDPASAIVEASLTRVAGRLVKLCAWYDNEWGFCNRMLDTAVAFVRV